MGEQAAALATRFEQTNEEIMGAIAAFSETRWQQVAQQDQRSLGVLCHHIGSAYAFATRLVQTLARGEPLPELTMAQINAFNAQHAQQFAACAKAETLAVLAQNGAAAAAAVRGLSDEHLARTGVLLGQPMSTQQLIEYLLVGHAQDHWRSIREGLDAPLVPERALDQK